MKTIDKIKQAYRSKPFRPFVVFLNDGRKVPVYNREAVLASPGMTRLVISQPGENLAIIDHESVVDCAIAKMPKAAARRSKKMTIEQVKRLYDAQPFQPFIIHLASGREVAVPHREFMWPAPSGRTISVELPDESVDIIDLLLMTDIVRMPATNGKRKKKGH